MVTSKVVVTSKMSSAPAELEQKAPAPANCGPMTQQGTLGGHGHEMHPQEFLRLIGCHQSGREKDEIARPLQA
jgi:hypothetical protein